MNIVDILIIAILCGGTVIGFYHGLVRTAFHMLILYGATVIAAFAYPTLAKWIRYIAPDSNPQLRQARAFVFLLLLLFNVVAFSVRAPFKSRDPFLPAMIDKPGGMVAGFFLASLWIGICLVVADYLMSVSWVKWEPLRHSTYYLVMGSVFARQVRGVLPYALDILRPWFAPFGGLPPLLYGIK
jgi:uncharacterized membrane protein required for colicin V production